ncbi:MAG: hypothetical protein HY718_18675 [Planctomycetes bacterium]|nr:hypothetical protein [Planctomycetota bacterium]
MISAALPVQVAVVGLAGTLPAGTSEFAAEVVEYVQGGPIPADAWTGIPFNNPAAALGPPTVDTTDDPAPPAIPADWWPVNPVYQPFRVYETESEPVFEIVSIGQGGRLVLKFDHPVLNDPRNPCGVDFIVFGNANMRLCGGAYWNNGMDPSAVCIDSRYAVRAEPGVVSVSQTGEPGTWRTFNDPNDALALKADSWAPTLGRVLRVPIPPSTNWWAEPTDPTLPFTPNLPMAAFGGLSMADACRLYGHSAGGTGFDLSRVGLDWMQYVRIEQSGNWDVTPEIDAVSDVRAFAFPDFDCDTDVDSADFEVFEACATGPAMGPPASGCERADLDDDGDVDAVDFGIYQRCISGPGRLAEFDCLGA